MKSKQIIKKPIYKNNTNHKDKLAQQKHSKILQKKNKVENSEIISPNIEPNYDNLYFFYKKHKVLFVFGFFIYLMALTARVNGKDTKESMESKIFTKKQFFNEENNCAKNQTLLTQSSISDGLSRTLQTLNKEYLSKSGIISNKLVCIISILLITI
ncbi:MAG: hypothetical protein HYX60_08095 [Legionella longbeachae]|nr:hypothetical protein [Legionella longbeachae]